MVANTKRILIFVGVFFQAEDGIRDGTVTGVQTCALPIWTDREGVASLCCGFPFKRDARVDTITAFWVSDPYTQEAVMDNISKFCQILILPLCPRVDTPAQFRRTACGAISGFKTTQLRVEIL